MMKREIFVFGSNKAGRHGRGAALYAKDNYGARMGVGEGLTGDSYAIPTKGHSLENLPYEEIDLAIGRFISVANGMPDVRFLLTPVATGLAGHSRQKVLASLRKYGLPKNVVLTSSWVMNKG